MHDKSVCLEGIYEKAVEAIKLAKSKGFRVSINCTLFSDAEPERVAAFFDEMKAIGLDGITVSPGYAYERAPDQEHFLNRERTKKLFRGIFSRGKGGKEWPFSQSAMFLDFLAGNQTYHCTPWGNPTRTVFGWQRPCYLLGEGYAPTFRELMEETDWDRTASATTRSARTAWSIAALRRPPSSTACAAADRPRRHAQRCQNRWTDGAGDSAGSPAAGAVRVLTPRRTQARRDPRRQTPH